jgi:hypothetical protein
MGRDMLPYPIYHRQLVTYITGERVSIYEIIKVRNCISEIFQIY